MGRTRKARSGPLAVVLGWAVLATLALGAAYPNVTDLGLYYDEAFLAQQARDFLEPDRRVEHPGSVRQVEVLGRPFPIRNAAYLGSLKSQLLIPAFWLFDATPSTLRLATLSTALLAVLFSMLFADRLLGTPIALLSGLLLVADPSIFFFSQFEWGPFTTNWLCRAAGLLLLAYAWDAEGRASDARAFAGGLLLGLGVFSRADFAVIVGALALSTLIGHRRVLLSVLHDRSSVCIAALLGLLLGASPMLASAFDLLHATGVVADRGGLQFRLGILAHVLDGSQFFRLMQTGGLFDEAAAVVALRGYRGWALGISWVVVGADLWARRQSPGAERDPRRLLWIATALIGGAMLLLPGAVRAHHQLNLVPFAQWIVASGALVLWRRAPGRVGLIRSALVLALGLLLFFDLRVIAGTKTAIEETGGRGRFTSETATLAALLESEPNARGVSLDWGFHEPLLFLTREARLDEAIWSIPRAFAQGQPWQHEGDADTYYLVHDRPYDLFGLGPLFLDFTDEVPPEQLDVQTYRDRQGAVAFYAIRILKPHRLVYTGRFRVEPVR